MPKDVGYSKAAGKGYGSMNSTANGKGIFSSKKNPMPKARQVMPEAGPGANPDQMKANKLLQQSQKKDESLRGMGVL